MAHVKKKLLRHLAQGVYCKLGVSPIHGIGVFAIRAIPKGGEPLRAPVRFDDLVFSHAEIKKLPASVRREIKMFCYYDDKEVHIPAIGLNAANMSVYLNHSKKPNVEFKKNGQLVALRAIKTIPGARLVLFPDLGHAPQIQNFERFKTALINNLTVLEKD